MSEPYVRGREICQAMAEATGIQRIKNVKTEGGFDDVTEWTVTFLPSEEQVRRFSESLIQQLQE